MLKRLTLIRDPSLAQQGVEIDHLMGRFIHDLPREMVFDRRWSVADFEPLSPAAVDVIEEPLERPQAADQPKARTVIELSLARRLDNRLHWRGAALSIALLEKFSRQLFSGQVRHIELSRLARSRLACHPVTLYLTPAVLPILSGDAPALKLLHGESVELRGILPDYLAAIRFRHRLEMLLEKFARMRPRRGLMRIVSRPHEIVDAAGEVPINSQTFRVVDESGIDLAGKILAGFH